MAIHLVQSIYGHSILKAEITFNDKLVPNSVHRCENFEGSICLGKLAELGGLKQKCFESYLLVSEADISDSGLRNHTDK